MNSVYFEKIGLKDIFCYLAEPEPTQKKIVIMTHGFRGSSIGPARTFVDFERLLVANGISVLRFDQPNSGNSSGDHLDSSFNEWVNTVVYFSKKYLDAGYRVALFGQSMGATAVVAATSKAELKGKIPCVILWVPDPKTDYDEASNDIYEENGQKYRGNFFEEAKNTDFFQCLKKFSGNIHLVYGENDRFISPELRDRVIEQVKSKNQSVILLKNQNHSPWDYDAIQPVYLEGLKLIKDSLVS